MSSEELLTLPTFYVAYVLILCFILGTVFASALMCLCYRMAHNEKWSKGKSHCDSCGHELAAKDLIPIISWISTKGRCRYCGSDIGKSAVIGELVLGIVSAALPLEFGMSIDLIKYMIFVYLLFCMAWSDIYSFEIPDRFWIIGCLAFLACLPFSESLTEEITDALIGGAVIAGGVFALSLAFGRIIGKEAMGMADIKLMFMTGLYLGFFKNLMMLIMSCIIGIVLSKVLKNNAPEDGDVPEGAFPFGPAIAVSAVICLFAGDLLVDLYLGLFNL